MIGRLQIRKEKPPVNRAASIAKSTAGVRSGGHSDGLLLGSRTLKQEEGRSLAEEIRAQRQSHPNQAAVHISCVTLPRAWSRGSKGIQGPKMQLALNSVSVLKTYPAPTDGMFQKHTTTLHT